MPRAARDRPCQGRACRSVRQLIRLKTSKENRLRSSQGNNTPGSVLGIAMTGHRTHRKATDRIFLAIPGDDVKLTFPTVGQPPKAVSDNFHDRRFL